MEGLNEQSTSIGFSFDVKDSEPDLTEQSTSIGFSLDIDESREIDEQSMWFSGN